MHDISGLWLLVITGLSIGPLYLALRCLGSTRKKIPLVLAGLSIYLYSGLGIAYPNVDKKYILYYISYLYIVCIAYVLFVRMNKKIVLSSKLHEQYRSVDDQLFWESRFAYNVFGGLFYVYIGLRLISIIYPVNRLASFSFIYSSIGNLANLTGENSSIITTLCGILSPFFYIGLIYKCNKVRQAAFYLGEDILITWIGTGYVSRHLIITAVLICMLLYFNADLNDNFISLNQKRKRIVFSSLCVIPVLIWVMLKLMESRITTGKAYSFGELIYSEICYPTQYGKIFEIAPISTAKDFFLQLLDSFVPIIPTPKYHMDINVDYSIICLGYGLDTSWFSILLPSILGESILIFGNVFFWVHGIIVALLLSLIYKITRNNSKVVALWYYYCICALKVGRAGYEQLSQSVLLNYIVLTATFFILRRYWRRHLYRGGSK